MNKDCIPYLSLPTAMVWKEVCKENSLDLIIHDEILNYDTKEVAERIYGYGGLDPMQRYPGYSDKSK